MIDRYAMPMAMLLAAVQMPQAAHAQAALPEVTVTAEPAREPASLTVPDTAQATADIERTPGGVEVVPDTAFKAGPAQTVKDVLGWVPGVFAQPRYGDDARTWRTTASAGPVPPSRRPVGWARLPIRGLGLGDEHSCVLDEEKLRCAGPSGGFLIPALLSESVLIENVETTQPLP